jgi:hypothetical protein
MTWCVRRNCAALVAIVGRHPVLLPRLSPVERRPHNAFISCSPIGMPRPVHVSGSPTAVSCEQSIKVVVLLASILELIGEYRYYVPCIFSTSWAGTPSGADRTFRPATCGVSFTRIEEFSLHSCMRASRKPASPAASACSRINSKLRDALCRGAPACQPNLESTPDVGCGFENTAAGP